MLVICVTDHANGPSRDEKLILTEVKTLCHECNALFLITNISDSMSVATYTGLLRNSWEYKVTAYDRASTATLSSTIPSLSDEEVALIKSRSLERQQDNIQQYSPRSFANQRLCRDNIGAVLNLDCPTFTTFGFVRDQTRGRTDTTTSDDLLAPILRLTVSDSSPPLPPLRVTRSTEDMLACPNGYGIMSSSPTGATPGLSPTNNHSHPARDDLLRPSQLRGQRKTASPELDAASSDSITLESSCDSMKGVSRGAGVAVVATGNVQSAKAKLAARFCVTRSSSALNVASPVMEDNKRGLHPFRKGFAAWQARSTEESVAEREKTAAQRLVGRLSAGGKYQSFMDQLNANIARGTQASPTAPLALPELIEDQEIREESGDENLAVSASPGSERQFLLGLKKKAAIRPPDRSGLRRIAAPTLLPSQHLSLSQDDGEIVYPARASLPEFVAKHAKSLKIIASPLEDNVFFPSPPDEPSGSHEGVKNGIKTKAAKPKREKESKSTKKLKEKKQKKADTFEAFAQCPDNPVPLFLEMCTKFIESKGLDTEGIYRVSGSRIHADQLLSKFLSNPASVDLAASDIPVYNVTTAVKTYLADHTPPIIPQSFVDELHELNFTKDKGDRIQLIKTALARFSAAHYQVLKFLFAHLRRISENSRKNKMDAHNLTVCLWPTLYPVEFPSDMAKFECIRVGISEIISTMITDYDKIFEPNYSPLPLSTSPHQIGSLAQEAAEAARLRSRSHNTALNGQASSPRPSLPHVPPPASNASSSSSLENGNSSASTAARVKPPVLTSLKSVQV